MNLTERSLGNSPLDDKEHIEKPKVCLFCKINAPDKSNTHLITNSIMRPAINQPGRGKEKNSELYWNISLGRGEARSRPYVGRSTNAEKLADVFGTEEIENIIDGQSDSYAKDYVFCTACENKFAFLESLYTKFSEKNITNKPEIQPNRLDGFEVFETSDKFQKQLIYSFIMLNVWRYGIFQFTDSRSAAILEATRQSLWQLLGPDEDSTKANLTEIDIKPFYPIFIGYYKVYEVAKTQEENDLALTKTFTFSSESLNFFQFGLYTVIFEEHLSDHFSKNKNYFGLEREIKIVDSVSVDRSVRIAFLSDLVRQTVLRSFIEQVVIPGTRNDMITIAKGIYAESNYQITPRKILTLWEKYRQQVSIINLDAQDNRELITKLIYELER